MFKYRANNQKNRKKILTTVVKILYNNIIDRNKKRDKIHMKEIKMTSLKPYMIRAFCEWIADNNDNPILVVFMNYPQFDLIEGVKEVETQVEDGIYLMQLPIETLKKTVFDINQTTIPLSKNLTIPTNAIVGVMSQKHGVIQRFEIENSLLPEKQEDNKQKNKKPTLTIVK